MILLLTRQGARAVDRREDVGLFRGNLATLPPLSPWPFPSFARQCVPPICLSIPVTHVDELGLIHVQIMYEPDVPQATNQPTRNRLHNTHYLYLAICLQLVCVRVYREREYVGEMGSWWWGGYVGRGGQYMCFRLCMYVCMYTRTHACNLCNLCCTKFVSTDKPTHFQTDLTHLTHPLTHIPSRTCRQIERESEREREQEREKAKEREERRKRARDI